MGRFRPYAFALGMVAVSIALATFTMWGFDPKEWDPFGRFGWAFVTLYFAGSAFLMTRGRP